MNISMISSDNVVALTTLSSSTLCLSVVLLDDPLSAVDARVGSLIFFECIMKALRGRGKGVILATHQLQYMRYADRILALDKDGHQIFYGAYSELQEEKEIFAVLSASVEEHTADDEEGVGEEEGEGEEGRSSSPWRESEKASRHAHDDIPHPVDKPPSPDLPPTYDDASAVPFTATQRLSLPTVSSTCTPSTPPSIGSPEISNPSTPRTITPCAMYLDASARTYSPNTLEAIFSQSDAMMDDRVFVPIPPTDAAIAAPLVVPQRMTPTAITTTTTTATPPPPPPPALRYDIKLSTRGKVPPPDISVKKSLLPLEASASLATKLSPDDGHIAGEVEEVETKSVDQIIVSEDRVEGRLSLRIWRQYFRAGTFTSERVLVW